MPLNQLSGKLTIDYQFNHYFLILRMPKKKNRKYKIQRIFAQLNFNPRRTDSPLIIPLHKAVKVQLFILNNKDVQRMQRKRSWARASDALEHNWASFRNNFKKHAYHTIITLSENTVYCCAWQLLRVQMEVIVGWEQDALKLTRVGCNVTLCCSSYSSSGSLSCCTYTWLCSAYTELAAE